MGPSSPKNTESPSSLPFSWIEEVVSNKSVEKSIKRRRERGKARETYRERRGPVSKKRDNWRRKTGGFFGLRGRCFAWRGTGASMLTEHL